MLSLLSLAATFAAVGALRGEVITVDVAAWAEVGTGETNGWTVGGIGSYVDGGAMFSSASDFARSPRFEDSVTQIVMSVKSSSLDVVKKLMITPVDPDGIAGHEATPTDSKYVSQVFSWSLADGVRQFCLQESSGASGKWGVASLSVYTDGIEPPTGLREEALYRDAFVAGWDAAPKAVRHEVRFASVTRVPPQFEMVDAWDFSSLTNATGNSKDLEALRRQFPEALVGVTGTNLGLQKYDGGHLQIGQDNVAGAMELQLDATVSSRICLIANWRHDKDSSSGCSAFCLGGDGSTNAVVSLTAGADPVTDMIALPDGTCTLRVESPKSRRVEISSVIVAVDYVPSSVTTNGFSAVGAKTAERMLRGLWPGEWVWAVRSFDAEGRGSQWSPFRTVVLDANRPHGPRRGFGLLVR